jgi:radical SAM protein with 4Fe4S-binding SPASM domain
MNRRGPEQRSRNQVRKTNSTAETRRAQRKTELGAPAESCSKCTVLRICTAMIAARQSRNQKDRFMAGQNHAKRGEA